LEQEIRPMMGERRVMQEALFYGFSLERYVPDNHLLRKIDRFVRPSPRTATAGFVRAISCVSSSRPSWRAV
jgi:hypothetical protein